MPFPILELDKCDSLRRGDSLCFDKQKNYLLMKINGCSKLLDTYTDCITAVSSEINRHMFRSVSLTEALME